MMAYENLAKMIVENVGGEENIASVTHCATRLRFKLKDDSKANKEKLEASPDILQAQNKGGQYQVIIGTEVPKVYAQLVRVANIEVKDKEESKEKPTGNIIGRFFNVVSGIFTPLLPALAGAGILRGLLLLFVQLGWMSESSGTYGILSAASMAVFYFLPVLLAFTSAKRFGANPYIAAVIGASLIHPDFMDLLGNQGTGATTDFLGIPVILMTYSSTVIPSILAVWVYSYLEKFLEKYIWKSVQIIFVPLISLVIIVPLTVILFGPFGVYAGEGIANGINWLSESNGWITGLVVGGVWNVFVVFGLQWAVNPIMISNISTLGFDKIVPLTAAANFGMAGATLGVIIKTRSKKMRSFSLSALLSIFFAGITEPAIYGVAMKLKRPFIAAIIGGAVGGAYIGGTGVISHAFVFGGLTTLPAFVGDTFIHYIIGLLICFVVSAIAAVILGFKDSPDEAVTTESATPVENAEDTEAITGQVITSPLNGEIVDLKEVNDGVFSEGLLGKGVAILPSDGKVYAPENGTMTTVFPTKHAYGITTSNGAEILIHIGINTVELDGEFFTAHVKQDQTVKAGELIAEFDMEQIKAKGYPMYTPVLVTNSAEFKMIEPVKDGEVVHGDNLLELSKD
jgi:PTS system beta-glucosides-specific IIC component